MKASLSASLLLSLCVLRAACQVPPYRYGATVLRDSCPSPDDVASQTTEPTMSSVLSNIATRIANGTGAFDRGYFLWSSSMAWLILCNSAMYVSYYSVS